MMLLMMPHLMCHHYHPIVKEAEVLLGAISTSIIIILSLMEHFLISGVQLIAFRLHAGRPHFKDLILASSLHLQEVCTCSFHMADLDMSYSLFFLFSSFGHLFI
jgi:hypothetical protein